MNKIRVEERLLANRILLFWLFLASSRKYPYFYVVVGLEWSNDPESYAGGRVATVRASHAGQVKGDDPGEKGYRGPSGWRLGMRMISPHKRVVLTSEMPRRGLINRRLSGYKGFDFWYMERPNTVKTWNTNPKKGY